MSKKKRAIERQKKRNSTATKLKQEKKRYYASYEAKSKWDEKKAKKEQSQCTKRESKGIPKNCPVPGWEIPTIKHCKECTVIRCTYKFANF